MFARILIPTVGLSMLLFGCSTEPGIDTDEQQEIVDNLLQAGYQADDLRIVEGKVYVGNDAEVNLAASREMLVGAGSTEEHYRSTNLVGGPNPSTICVNGAPLAPFAVLSQGLDLAIGNYNALFNAGIIRLRFQRVNGGPVAGCTFFINSTTLAGVQGGSAGFPSGGLPFGIIRIGTGLVAFSIDVSEHVITHELGHCIGLRHTDFFNRSISCGGAPVNEENPPSGIGAIHIPGTPPTGAADPTSIMNSCFSAAVNGEFSGSDITALNFLY